MSVMEYSCFFKGRFMVKKNNGSAGKEWWLRMSLCDCVRNKCWLEDYAGMYVYR